jgi:dihydropyrimidinase
MIDLVIKNARAVDETGVSEENLWIHNGKIVGRVGRGESVQAKKEIDAAGRYVLPGAIDSHSHIGQLPGEGHFRPQAKQEENYLSESASALMGGTTTALNYMFSPKSYEDVIAQFIHWVEDFSLIDMKFHGGLLNELHVQNIEKYVKDFGLTSFKIYLPYKGEEAAKLGGLTSLTDGQVLEAFTRLKKYNAISIVHCENPELIDYYMAKNQKDSKQSLADWEATRPGIVEGEASEKILYFARKIGNRVGIAHVSSAETVECIENNRDLQPILETCTHYLALTCDNDLGPLGKVSPPIRGKKDQEKLWNAIASYPHIIIGSDHNAWQKVHKQELWSGFAGLPNNATILPVLFTEGVDKRGLSVEDVVRISSRNAAQLFGLYPRKGTLKVGSDADIVIMNTGIKKKLDPKELPSISDFTPFKDYTFTAWPASVIVRGEAALIEGEKYDLSQKAKVLNSLKR